MRQFTSVLAMCVLAQICRTVATMSIRPDEASAAIPLKTKAERSSDCNKSGTAKIQLGRFVYNAIRRDQERNLLQTVRPAAQNRVSLLKNLREPAPLHRS